MKKKVIIIVIVILLVCIGSIYAMSKMFLGRMKSAGPGMVVRVETISTGNLNEFISAPGQVEPETSVNISARVSAKITELPFEEGDRVYMEDLDASPAVTGSVVARLDSKDLESALASTIARFKAQETQLEVSKANLSSKKAQLAGTKSSLDKAKRDFERQQQLFGSKDISQSAFDDSKQTYEGLQSQYDAAMHGIKADELGLEVSGYNLEASQAQIDEAREALSHTTIIAPMDGIITRLNVEVGEIMTGSNYNAGTVLMTIADLSKMLLVAQVDETDIGKLKVGQDAEIRVKAFWNEVFKGTVDNIALMHTMGPSGTKYFRTEIVIHGDVSKLYSGLTADVDIFTEKHDGIIKVPSQAVLGRKVDDIPLDIRDNNPNVDTKKNDVMVVYRMVDGKSVVTPVTIGPGDLTHIIIESGLSEEDKIVIGPYKILEGLRHDQAVRDEREVEAEKKEKEKKKKDKGDKDGDEEKDDEDASASDEEKEIKSE